MNLIIYIIKLNSQWKKEINKINFLDLSIEKTHNNLQLGIYRKPAATDLIIHYDSWHPYEHKRAAINFLINRMNTYPLSYDNKNKEETIIRTILNNNNYPQNTIQRIPKPSKKNNIKKRDHLYLFRT
jgi:hypothetical protein